jgi:hypothetical protein
VLATLRVANQVRASSILGLKNVTKSQPSTHQTRLHCWRANDPTKLQSAMRSNKIVKAAHQLKMSRQSILPSGVTQAATAQIRATLPSSVPIVR